MDVDLTALCCVEEQPIDSQSRGCVLFPIGMPDLELKGYMPTRHHCTLNPNPSNVGSITWSL